MILLYETKATLQLLIRGNYRSNIDSGGEKKCVSPVTRRLNSGAEKIRKCQIEKHQIGFHLIKIAAQNSLFSPHIHSRLFRVFTVWVSVKVETPSLCFADTNAKPPKPGPVGPGEPMTPTWQSDGTSS